MPKPNLDEIQSIPDPMLSDNFELLFPNIPGAQGDTATRALRLQCKNTIKPGTQMEDVPVELFGHRAMHAGRRTFSNEISVEFIEDAFGTIGKSLESWVEWVRSKRTQSGHFKRDYAQDAVLNIFDQEGNQVLSYKIVNMWPSNVPDETFDGSSATAISLSCSFKYDYYLEDGEL